MVNDAIYGLAHDFNLIECSSVVAPSLDYTFHVVSTGHRSMIDWWLVSNVLRSSVVTIEILDYEPNLSDHSPSLMDLKFDNNYLIDVGVQNPNGSFHNIDKISQKLRWDLANLNDYYEISRTTLQPVLDELRPIYLKLMNEFVYSHANNICSSSKLNVVSNYSICRAIAVHLIDKYYPLVTNAFANAANRTVPRGKSDALKHWWSNDLQNEKIKSIESPRLWVDAGRPRSGPIFDLYKNHKFAYKLAIRNAKCNAELSITNDLHDALCSKDTNSFWKIWNSKLGSNNLNKPRIVDGLVDGQAIADRF